MISILLIVVNAMSGAVSNVLSGVASRTRPVPIVLAASAVTALIVIGSASMLVGGPASADGIAIGLAAGLIGGAALPVAYRAFAIGPVGVVAAVIAVTGTATIAVAGIVAGAALTPARIVGLVLCLIAIVLVTWQPGPREKRTVVGVILSIVAALGFSGFVVLIERAPPENGLWPIFAARVSVIAVAGVLLLSWQFRHSRTSTRTMRWSMVWIPALAGTVEAIGNLALVFALRTGDLILVALLAPVAPVATAIIGKLFLDESLTRVQVLGLAVAMAAIVSATLWS